MQYISLRRQNTPQTSIKNNVATVFTESGCVAEVQLCWKSISIDVLLKERFIKAANRNHQKTCFVQQFLCHAATVTQNKKVFGNFKPNS